MIEIIWAIINIGILVSFLIICFKATKIIKEKLGIISAVIFVLGLMSFASANKNDYGDENKIFDLIENKQMKSESQNGSFTFKKIDENLASKIILGVVVENRNGELTAKSCTVTKSGLNAGCYWKANMVNITKLNDKRFFYNISGEYNWKIFGMNILTENKNFKGVLIP